VNYAVSSSKLYLERSYKNPITKEKWRDCSFIFAILLKKSALDFVITYKEDLVAAVEAEYKDDL